MDVSDVLRDRMHEPAGLQGMAVASVLAHAAIAALVVLAPGVWFGRAADPPHTVMTITLGGGTPGPENGGMTTMSGRPIQEQAPPVVKPPREAPAPPAPKAPAMTLPRPGSVPLKRQPPAVAQAPDDAHGRAPTRGAEVSAGSALAETGVRGQGFGLSTGGGASSGSAGWLDVADFCCPDYLALMVQRIRSNWNPQAETPGDVVVKFTIQRSGALTDTEVEQSSGYAALDLNARRALASTRQLPALPDAFPNATLTVHLRFQYTR
jgi:TonB family protein